MKDYYRSALVFRKATYFTRKKIFLTTNESEPMGLGRTSTRGYTDENVFYVYCLKNNHTKNFISLLLNADSLRFCLRRINVSIRIFKGLEINENKQLLFYV